MFKMKKSILFISIMLILAISSAVSYFALTSFGIIDAGKVEITIKLNDNMKVYDGEALTGASYEITNGSIANTHKLEVTYTSSLTNVGETPLLANARVVDENGKDVSKDYDISVTQALLKVTPRPITVKAKDTSKIYDGTPIVSGDMEIIEGTLAKGDDVQPSIEVKSQDSDTGEYIVDLTAEVFDFAGNNVTANYSVSTVTCKLVIDKAPLTIQTKSATYDFGPDMYIDPQYEIVSGELIEGDDINVQYKPVEQKVGVQVLYFEEGEGWITIKNTTGEEIIDVTNNYLIAAQSVGLITVNPHLLNIDIAPETKLEYNAEEQSSDEFTYVDEADEEFMGNYDVVATGTKVKDVGTYENILTFVITEKSTGKDVSDYFVVEQPNAKITIEPYVLSNDEFVFDDTELIYNDTYQYPKVVSAELLGDDVFDYDYIVYDEDGEEIESIKAGDYTVEIIIKGRDFKNYKINGVGSDGVITKDFTIKPYELSSDEFSLDSTTFVYNGLFQHPSVVRENLLGDDVLDYDYVVYDESGEEVDSIIAGFYTVEITISGDDIDNYEIEDADDGVIVEDFEIEALPIEISEVDYLELSMADMSKVLSPVDLIENDYTLATGDYIELEDELIVDLDVIDLAYGNDDLVVSFVITNKDGEDVTDSYEFADEYLVPLKLEKLEIIFESNGYTKTYDGNFTELAKVDEDLSEGYTRNLMFDVQIDYVTLPLPTGCFVVYDLNYYELMNEYYIGTIKDVIDSSEYDIEIEPLIYFTSSEYDIDVADEYDVTDYFEIQNEGFGFENVEQKEISVVIGEYSKVYDGKPIKKEDITPTLIGVIDEEDYNKVFPTIRNNLSFESNPKVNEYDIYLDFEFDDDENYTLDINNIEEGVFEITKRPVVVTIGELTKVYDGTNANLTQTPIYVSNVIEGEENIVINSIDKSMFYCYDTKNAGTHEIEYYDYPENIDLENYEITDILPGTLEITKRQVSVTIGTLTKVYDGTNANLTQAPIEVTNAVSGQENIIKNVISKSDLYCDDLKNAGTHEIEYLGYPQDIYLDNYEVVDIVSGTLEIAKRQVSVTIGTLTKVYDGENANISSVSINVSNAVSGQENIIKNTISSSYLYCAELKNVGTYEIEYLVNPEDIYLENYEVVDIVSGTLEITKRQVVVTIGSLTKVYDGANANISSVSINVSNAISGQENTIKNTISSSYLYCDDLKNVGTYEIEYLGDPQDIYLDNYEVVDIVSGTLEITKRQVVVTIGTLSKVYDGANANISSVSINVSNAISGQESTIKNAISTSNLYCDDLKNAGTHVIEYQGNPEDIYLENYEVVDIVSGILEITKRQVVVTIGTLSKVYDGANANISSVSINVSNAISGQESTIKNAISTSNLYCDDLKNAGTHVIEYQGNPEDIYLDNYEVVDIVSGTLEITKRQVVVTIGSMSKVYDGTNANISSVSINVSNAISGQESTIKNAINKSYLYCTELKNVGTYEIEYLGSLEGIYLENYEVVDIVFGTLEITKARVIVYIGHYVKEYDGTSLSSSAVNPVAMGAVSTSDENSILSQVSYSIASYATVGEDYAITANNSEFEIGNYSVEVIDGSFDIVPRTVVVSIGSYSMEYNGYEFDSSSIVPVFENEIEEPTVYNILFNGSYSAIEKGTYTITFNVANNSNYNFVLVDGTLVIY